MAISLSTVFAASGGFSGGPPPEVEGEELKVLLERGYRYALCLTHDETQADGLVQDAWLQVLRTGAPLRVGALLRAVRRRFLELDPRQGLVVLEPDDPAEPPPALEGIVSEVDEALFERALSLLRTEEREVLYLLHVEGFEAERVAELTRRPVATVENLRRHGEERLWQLCVRWQRKVR